MCNNCWFIIHILNVSVIKLCMCNHSNWRHAVYQGHRHVLARHGPTVGICSKYITGKARLMKPTGELVHHRQVRVNQHHGEPDEIQRKPTQRLTVTCQDSNKNQTINKYPSARRISGFCVFYCTGSLEMNEMMLFRPPLCTMSRLN